MRTTPVIDSQAPPTEGNFRIVAPGKGEGAANLMGAHTSRCPIAPFNRRGIGRGIPQLVKHLLDATLRTMGVADVHGHDALAFPMLHDLDMGQGARDTVAQVGKAPPISLAASMG